MIDYREIANSDLYIDEVVSLIIREEGPGDEPYLDTAFATPRLTIGYGFNIQNRLDLRDEVFRAAGFRVYLDDPGSLTENERLAEFGYIGELNNAINTGNVGELHNIMARRYSDSRYLPIEIPGPYPQQVVGGAFA